MHHEAAHHLAFPQQRHEQRGANASLEGPHLRWGAAAVRFILAHVGKVRDGPRRQHPIGHRIARDDVRHGRIERQYLVEILGYAKARHAQEIAAFVAQQMRGLRLAQPCPFVEHRLEHGLQFAGRSVDDAQHLGNRLLLLQ